MDRFTRVACRLRFANGSLWIAAAWGGHLQVWGEIGYSSDPNRIT